MSQANLAKAIINVMKVVKGMEKNSRVGSGGSAYNGTKYQDVAEAFNDALADNGLCILPIGIDETTQVDRWEEVDPWSKSTPKDMKTKQSVFTKVVTKYLLLHESGESQELVGYGHGVDPQDKGAGKSTTYAFKNALLYAFVTPVGKMDDTDTIHSNDIAAPKANKTAAKSATEKPAITQWMTEKQFKDVQALVSTDKVKAKKNFDAFSKPPYGMKKEYKDALSKLL